MSGLAQSLSKSWDLDQVVRGHSLPRHFSGLCLPSEAMTHDRPQGCLHSPLHPHMGGGMEDKISIGTVPIRARLTLGSGRPGEGSGHFLAVHSRGEVLGSIWELSAIKHLALI